MRVKLYTDYTVHLLRCSMTGEIPKPIPEEISIRDLFEFCKNHKIENTVYYPLKKICSTENMAEFEKSHFLAVVLDVNQDEALKKVSKALEQNKIKYMPLKGSVIKKIYNSTDMRQSADIDIYIGSQNAEKVKEIMLSMGYTVDESLFGIGPDDSYLLLPCVNIEMHRTLVPEVYKWKDECQRIEKNILPCNEDGYACCMSKEDFYVYMIMHIAKHMHLSGSGIRSIFDVWIYLETYKDSLDFSDINQSLQRASLVTFEKNIRNLAYAWFSNEVIEDDEELLELLAEHIAVGGWLGKGEYRNAKYIAETYSNKKSKKMSKLKYYSSLIFMKYDVMKNKYPVLAKHKYLMPIFWIVRLYESIAYKKMDIKKTSDKINNSAQEIELGMKMLEFDEKIGL